MRSANPNPNPNPNPNSALQEVLLASMAESFPKSCAPPPLCESFESPLCDQAVLLASMAEAFSKSCCACCYVT